MKRGVFGLAILLTIIAILPLQVNAIGACGTVATSDTLTANVSSAGTCITITGDNVDFNCQGNIITFNTGGGGDDSGIYVAARNNVTLRNCNIRNTNAGSLVRGINVSLSTNVLVQNMNISLNNSATSFGIFVTGGNNVNITQSTIQLHNTTSDAIELLGTRDAVISQNTLNQTNQGGSTHIGIAASSQTNSTIITNNIITSNATTLHTGISLSSGRNFTIGNNNFTYNGTSGSFIGLSNTNTSRIENNSYSGAPIGYSFSTVSFDNTINNENFNFTGASLIATFSGSASPANLNNSFSNITHTAPSGGLISLASNIRNNSFSNISATITTLTQNALDGTVDGQNNQFDTITLNIPATTGNVFAIENLNGSRFNNLRIIGAREWVFLSAGASTNFTNTTFETNFGSIRYPNTLVINGAIRLNQSNINISSNRVFVNSTNASVLNTSAEIFLANSTFISPSKLLVDTNDDGAFEECTTSTCTNIRVQGRNLTFNVTQFTSYSANNTFPATVIESSNLTSNITTNGTAFIINASNIVFDCLGFTITGNGFGVGVNATGRANITIRNCNVLNFTQNIVFNSTSNSSVLNSNFTNSTLQNILLINSSNNNTWQNISSASNSSSDDGVELSSSLNNIFNNLTATTRTQPGIRLTSSTNFTLNLSSISAAVAGATLLVSTTSPGTLITNVNVNGGTTGISIDTNNTLTNVSISGTSTGITITGSNNNITSLTVNTSTSTSISLSGSTNTLNNIFSNTTGIGQNSFVITGSNNIIRTTINDAESGSAISVSGASGNNISEFTINNGFTSPLIIQSVSANTRLSNGMIRSNPACTSCDGLVIGTTTNTNVDNVTIVAPTSNLFDWIFTGASASNASIRNITFETGNGSIRIFQNSTLPTSLSLSRNLLNISANRVFLNSSSLSFLNTSAQIILNSVNSNVLLVDFEDDGTYEACNATQCVLQSFNGSTAVFNVSSFTSYSTSDIGGLNVTLSKSDSPDPINLSNTTLLTYQINFTVTNGTAFNVTINETYPNNVTFVNSTPNATSGNNSWSAGNLTLGQTYQINITVNVSGGLANGTLLNNTVNATYANSTGNSFQINVTENTTVLNVAAQNLCGQNITTDTTITANHTCTNEFVNITADNVSLNCNGYVVTYDTGAGTSTTGITAINRTNISIVNCILVDGSASGATDIGIEFRNVSLGSIVNNTINSSGNMFSDAIFISTRGENITIANNTLNARSTLNDNNGIEATGLLNSTIRNNTITTNGTSNDQAIRLSTSSFVLIINNSLQPNGTITGQHGINIVSGSNIQVINNSITTPSASATRGIFLQTLTINSLILGNRISSIGNGIEISQSINNTVGGNNITPNSAAGIFMTSSSNQTLVENNTINSTNGNGIQFSNSNNNTVNNNTISAQGGSTVSGLSMSSGSFNNRLQNLVITTGSGGLDNAIDLQGVTNNSFVNITSPSNLGFGISLQVSSSNNNFSNMTITANGNALRILSTSNNNRIENSTFTAGSTATVADIQTTNTTLHNVTITSGSGIGLSFTGASQSNITNTTITSSSGTAATSLSGGSSNQFNNILTTASGGGAGLRIISSSSLNTVTNSNLATNSGNALLIDNSVVNNVFDNVTMASSTTGISFTTSSNNNTFNNSLILANTTWISTCNSCFNSTFINMTYRTNNGSIRIFSNTTLQNSTTVAAARLNISANRAFVNTTNLSLYNQSAQITLNNVNTSFILVDFEDDGNYELCNATQCQLISFAGGTIVFNVSSFTSYATQGIDGVNVTLTKSDSPDPLNISNSTLLTYQINFTPFNGSVNNVVINETYPNNITFVNSTPSPTVANFSWSAGNLSINQTFQINITVNVSSLLGNGTILNNTVNATYENSTGSQFQINVTENTTVVVNAVVNQTNATLTKSDSPDPINLSNTTLLTYQINFTVTNGTAFNVTINETYPNNVTFVNSTPNATSGNNSWSAGNLTLGQTYQINITVNVSSGLANGTLLNNTVNATYANSTGNSFQINVTENTTVLNVAAALACGDTLLNSTTLTSNLTCNGTALFIGANNVSLDCAGFTIRGNGSGEGVNSTGRINTTVRNCIISLFNQNILYNSTNNSLIINNTLINSSQEVIEIRNSNNVLAANNIGLGNSSASPTFNSTGTNGVTFANNTINSTISQGISINGATINALLINNTIQSNNTGIQLSASNNNLTLNNVTSIVGSAIILGGDNNTLTTNNFNSTSNNGIELSGGVINNTIIGNNATSSTQNGIRLQNSNNNTLINNTGISSTGDGVSIGGSFNVFTNMTAISGTRNAFVITSGNNNTLTTIFARSNITALNLTTSSNNTLSNIILESNSTWIVTTTGEGNAITNTTFQNSLGNIRILTGTTVPNATNVNVSNLNITSNRALLNSTAYSFLNQSAQITLLLVPAANTVPLVDLEDDNTFTDCPAPRCANFTNNAGTAVFNVSSFTTYSTGNGSINLTLTKTDSPDPLNISNSTLLTYQINLSIQNGTAYNITLMDIYPSQSTFVNSTPSPNASNNTWIIGNLSQNQTFQVNITVNVSSNLTNGTVINNTANISYANFTGSIFIANATQNTTIIANLTENATTVTLTKTDSPDPVIAGQPLTYTITINVTNGTAFNMTLTDIYPAQVAFVNSTPSPNASNNTWIIGNLSQNQTFQVNITVTVNSNVSNGTTINNTANISFANSTGNITTQNTTIQTLVSTQSFPLVINNNTNITTNGTSSGPGIIINASNVTVDCNNNIITGSGSNVGLNITGFNNVTVQNCAFTNFATGGHMEDANLTKFNNNTFTSMIDAIKFVGSSQNAAFNNTLVASTDEWVFTSAGSTGNALQNTSYNGTGGQIIIIPAVTHAANANVSQINLNISSQKAFINSTLLPFLDVSSQVTITGLTNVSQAIILGDFDDDGVFQICGAPFCTFQSFSGGTAIFNTTGWTTYTNVDSGVNFTITKTSSPNPATPGGQVIYTITVAINSGFAQNISVVESSPPELTFVTSTPTNVSANTWNLSNLSAGQSSQINITYNVSANFTGTLQNNVTVTFQNSTNGTITANVSQNTTVQIASSGGGQGGGGGGGGGGSVCPPICQNPSYRGLPQCSSCPPPAANQTPAASGFPQFNTNAPSIEETVTIVEEQTPPSQSEETYVSESEEVMTKINEAEIKKTTLTWLYVLLALFIVTFMIWETRHIMHKIHKPSKAEAKLENIDKEIARMKKMLKK